MSTIYSIDLMINDDYSADAIYQECLSKTYKNNFQLFTSNTYNTNNTYSSNILYSISNKNIINKLYSLIKNAFIISNRTKNNKDVIFVFQSFFASEIIMTLIFSLINLISFDKRKFTFVLIMRFEFSIMQNRILPLFLNYLPKRNKIILFTDTKELQLIHEKKLNSKVILLPIPHTFSCQSLVEQNCKLFIGFPGFPRKEKGIELIERIIENINDKEIVFNLQEWPLYKNTFSKKNNVSLEYFTKSRKDYINYICSCDVIILPYTNSNYINRSSGIFAESIVASKIVLVSNGTWMSNQLKSMNLDKYIINDFNDFNEIKNKIFFILNNFLEVKKEFERKTISFSKFHNQEYFNKILLENSAN